MKYRKKPIVIEAFMYGIEPRPNWFVVCSYIGYFTEAVVE
jgi:hypothetical protein